MGLAMKLADYLAAHPVPFELVAHSHTRSSLQSARSLVYFEVGDHETSVHLMTRDFVGLLEGARHMDFSAPM